MEGKKGIWPNQDSFKRSDWVKGLWILLITSYFRNHMHRHFLTHVAVNAGQLCCSRLSPGVSFCIWFTAWPSTNHLPLGSRHAVWKRVNSIAPHYPVLTDPWKRLPCQESLREFEGAGWHSLGWVWRWEVKQGILYIVGDTVITKIINKHLLVFGLKWKGICSF